MASPLADLPKDSVVFVDANIFHFFLRGPSSLQRACTAFLRRIESEEIAGYTSALVLDELIYKILLKKVEEKHRRNPLAVLKEHPDEVSVHSREIRRAVEILLGIEALDVIAVEKSHIEDAVDWMQNHSVLPRHAIHLSVMSSLACHDIASADSDFDRVTGISRWTPV